MSSKSGAAAPATAKETAPVAKAPKEELNQTKAAQPLGPVPVSAKKPAASTAAKVEPKLDIEQKAVQSLTAAKTSATPEAPAAKAAAAAAPAPDRSAAAAAKTAVKPATAVGKLAAGDAAGAVEQEKKKPAQTKKGDDDSQTMPLPGKAAQLVGGDARTQGAAAKSATAGTAKAKAAAPTSAAAVAGDKTLVTALDRQQATGSVVAKGAGALSDAAAPKAKAKAKAGAAPGTPPATRPTAAAGLPPVAGAAVAATASATGAAPPPPPASVIDIVSGVPQPVLESTANLPAPRAPALAAATASGAAPVGPARAYAKAAAPAMKQAVAAAAAAGLPASLVASDAMTPAPRQAPRPPATAGPAATGSGAPTPAASAAGRAAPVPAAAPAMGLELPAYGPAAVAVGRAVEQGLCETVKLQGSKAVVPTARKYQIVFCTSEVAPFSKTGGLGEAMDGLPTALAALGHRVMVIAPRYDQYKDAWDTGFWGKVKMAGASEPCHFFHAYRQKVDYVFVDHPTFLERVDGLSGAKLYGPEWGKDFADNQARFAYFCKAALVAIKDLPLGGFPYGHEVVVVANDWHSALVPMFIHADRSAEPELWKDTRTTFLCHNAVFQGRFEYEEGLASVFDVPQEYIDSITFSMPLKVGRYNKKVKCVNTMAAGVRYADRALTVSPSYAAECASDPEKGVELEELFALGRVTGVLNGVKEGVTPSDKNFATKAKLSCGTFTVQTAVAAKEHLKAVYRAESGLPESPGPMMCFIGRLDAQKGYDLLLDAIIEVLEDTDMQVVIVGAGRADLVEQTKAVEKKFPSKFFYAGWMGPERYALLAGCDFTLLPSRWEPCGLVQMEAMRMGTLPIVAPTGGLRDTVEDGINGIWTDAEMTVEAEIDDESVASIARALRRAAALYSADPAKVGAMKQAAMVAASEFTWSNAALQYEAIFEELGAKDVLPACRDGFVTLEVDKNFC